MTRRRVSWAARPINSRVAVAVATAALAAMFAASAGSQSKPTVEPPSTTYGTSPQLPPPTPGKPPGIHFPTLIGWQADEKPESPDGFDVARFAVGLVHPRWLHVLPNGDVLVAESRTERLAGDIPPPILEGFKRVGGLGPSANRITLLRDADADGRAEIRETFAANL